MTDLKTLEDITEDETDYDLDYYWISIKAKDIISPEEVLLAVLVICHFPHFPPSQSGTSGGDGSEH